MMSAVSMLRELCEDTAVPKNLRAKLTNTIDFLERDNGADALKIAKAMEHLEVLSEDMNLEPFVRTQLFNVVSMLEGSRW